MANHPRYEDFFRKAEESTSSGRKRDDRPREMVPGMHKEPFADGKLLIAPYVRHEKDVDPGTGERRYFRTAGGLVQVTGVNITAGPSHKGKGFHNIYVPIDDAPDVLDAAAMAAFQRCMAAMAKAHGKGSTSTRAAAARPVA
jgi:hypothetical protein